MKYLLATLLAALALNAQTPASDLEKAFSNPPDTARPRVYWYWINGNISKEGLTKDLEAMKRIGLSGAMMMEVALGIPEGKVRTGSPEWWEMIRHVLKEADRLGLHITFGNGTGWSGSQGPWVPASQAKQQVVSSETNVRGPSRFDAVLPQPPKKESYSDIAVLAIPATSGDAPLPAPTYSVEPVATAVRINSVKDSQNDKLEKLPAGTAVLGDGDPETSLRFPQFKNPTITIEFAEPVTVRHMRIVPVFWQSYEMELQASDDGTNFRLIDKLSVPAGGPVARGIRTLTFDPVTARWFRLVVTKFNSPYHGRFEIGEIALSGSARMAAWEAQSGLFTPIGSNKMPATTAQDGVNPEQVVDLTSKMSPDGHLVWDVPAGEWNIVRMGHTTVSEPYDTPPEWARGYETDKLSRQALDAHWAAYMEKIIREAGPLAGTALWATHVDSWESGSQNWTPLMREEFKKRRGYDMTPFLPAFTGRIVKSPEETQRFFWDVRRTIADLIADNYYGGLAQLAHSSGLKFSTEAYGNAVMDALQCAGRADVPMTEIWTGEIKRDPAENWYLKWGSSPANVYGRRLNAAEAFSTSPNKNLGLGRFLDHPFSIKAVGDNHIFGGGVNLLFIHVYAHQPWIDVAPGMTVGGWGIDFNRNQTWWDLAGPWVNYLSRCSLMLQQGLFVGDVLYLMGETPAGNGAAARNSLRPVLPKGYDYDACPAEALIERAQVKDGLIVFPDGLNYRYLVVNHGQPMTVKLVMKLQQLVADGATVVGPRPVLKAAGLSGQPEADKEVAAILSEMWGDCDGKKATENRYGKGRVVWQESFSDFLLRDGCPPDFTYQAGAETKLNYIHRRTNDEEIYFVSSYGNAPEDATLSFRVTGRKPEFWFPDTGRVEAVSDWREEGGRTLIPYRFDPFGSVFVVFREDNATPPAPGTARRNWQELTPLMKLDGAWTVQFDPKRGGPAAPVDFPELTDWSASTNAEITYYSGAATYRKTFEAPANLKSGTKVVLDLGKVSIMAKVKLNGREFGTLWKPPFQVDITDSLRSGSNDLEITVVNQWANRLIGDEKLPADVTWKSETVAKWPEWLLNGTPRTSGRTTFTTRQHWKKEDALQPSGLLGPVTLYASE